MQSFIRSFTIFDTFSVTFNQSLNPKKTNGFYKSPIGGFVSLIIYTFGLIYSINLMSNWIQNQMIMKVSSQAENYDRDIYQNIFNNSNITNFFEIYVVSNVDFDQMYDPFQEDEVIILPLMINDTSGELMNVLFFHNSINKTLDVLLNDSLEYNGYYIIFVPCIGNEQFLSRGQQCSNQSKADEYFSASGLQIEMTLQSETINIYTKEIIQLNSYPYIFVQPQIITFQSLILTYSYTEIRSGWFFTETEYYMLKTKYEDSTIFCQPGYLDNNFLFLNESAIFKTTLGVIFLSTDYNVNHVIAEYPTISEMLANIGSTCQTLLLIKYIVFLINRNKMQEEFQLFCRKLYFPELSQIRKIKIKKTTQYQFGQMQLEPKKYQDFLKQIDKKIDEKLNYANLIYEISRMQIIFQQIISKDINISSHNTNTKLNLEVDPKTGLYFINNYYQGCSKFKREEQILDPKYDPFMYNYSSNITRPDNKEEIHNIKMNVQNFRSPEIAFSNVEIPVEDLNQQFSESMRPQQSI